MLDNYDDSHFRILWRNYIEKLKEDLERKGINIEDLWERIAEDELTTDAKINGKKFDEVYSPVTQEAIKKRTKTIERHFESADSIEAAKKLSRRVKLIRQEASWFEIGSLLGLSHSNHKTTTYLLGYIDGHENLLSDMASRLAGRDIPIASATHLHTIRLSHFAEKHLSNPQEINIDTFKKTRKSDEQDQMIDEWIDYWFGFIDSLFSHGNSDLPLFWDAGFIDNSIGANRVFQRNCWKTYKQLLDILYEISKVSHDDKTNGKIDPKKVKYQKFFVEGVVRIIHSLWSQIELIPFRLKYAEVASNIARRIVDCKELLPPERIKFAWFALMLEADSCGWAYCDLGKYEDAQEIFEKVRDDALKFDNKLSHADNLKYNLLHPYYIAQIFLCRVQYLIGKKISNEELIDKAREDIEKLEIEINKEVRLKTDNIVRMKLYHIKGDILLYGKGLPDKAREAYTVLREYEKRYRNIEVDYLFAREAVAEMFSAIKEDASKKIDELVKQVHKYKRLAGARDVDDLVILMVELVGSFYYLLVEENDKNRSWYKNARIEAENKFKSLKDDIKKVNKKMDNGDLSIGYDEVIQYEFESLFTLDEFDRILSKHGRYEKI